jgi:ABC-2 type transport system ATP-binding protein
MASEEQSMIRTVGLTKTFRDFWLREKVTAVSGLDLDIQPGEVFGLLGPNGSGKSTTIKMILGLLFPTRGVIRVLGKGPTNVAVKRRIGFLPEESNLYPFLDAREILDYYGRLFQLPRSERNRRIDMLLDMVGLSGVAYRRVGEYSKGMARRIGLAQALINDPDLLILDEPTSGLDPLGTRQFKDLIRTLAGRGKTILLSSHLLADVEDVCDRICVLYGGQKRAQGDIDELLAQRHRTQITTGELDEKTIASLRASLGPAGRDLFEVSHPRDRLEDLFLRIVEDAQRQKLRSGGAMSGGKVAAFLAEADHAEGEDVIAALEAPDEPATEPDASQSTPSADVPQAPPAEAVLDDLLAEPAPPAGPSESAQSASPPSQPQQADRSVIDDLLEDDPADRQGGQGE